MAHGNNVYLDQVVQVILEVASNELQISDLQEVYSHTISKMLR